MWQQHRGCYACPIKCSRDSKVLEGAFAVEVEGPEYESTNALGPMCWISDPEAILYANRLCNEYGLDTISTGVVVAFALELRERGLLADEPDLPLAWGSRPLAARADRAHRAAPRHRRRAGRRARAARRSASAAGPSAMPCR